MKEMGTIKIDHYSGMTREDYIEHMKRSFFDQEEAEKMADYAMDDFGSYIEAYEFYCKHLPFTMAEALCADGEIKRKAHHVGESEKFISDVLGGRSGTGEETSTAPTVGTAVKKCNIEVQWCDGASTRFEEVNMIYGGPVLSMIMPSGKLMTIPYCNIRWFEIEEI